MTALAAEIMRVTVCVMTSLGSACALDAAPVGYCRPAAIANVVYCNAAVESIPLWASTYDPALGGINCNEDCSHKATGPVHADQYGHTAACPHDWLYLTVTTPHGRVLCDDRGGAVVLTWRRVYDPLRGFYWGWFWIVDFLISSESLPYWAYAPIYDWRLGGD